jgi:hypothetical protein
MAEGVLRRTLFAGLGARVGGGRSRVREVVDVERKYCVGRLVILRLLISTTVVVFSRRACGDLAYGQSLGNGTRLA